METFIVLGIIPGTNIETTFTFWVDVWLGLAALVLLRYALRNRWRLYTLWIAVRLSRHIDHYQFQLPA